MDCNELLTQMRRYSAGIMAMADRGEHPDRIAACGETLATITEALDSWLSNGGFLPTEWQRR